MENVSLGMKPMEICDFGGHFEK